MGKAKTASKNNPTQRQKAADVFFGGKKVVPCEIITENMRFIGAQYEDGNVVKDQTGNPIFWAQVQ